MKRREVFGLIIAVALVGGNLHAEDPVDYDNALLSTPISTGTILADPEIPDTGVSLLDYGSNGCIEDSCMTGCGNSCGYLLNKWEDRWVKVGAGLRPSFSLLEDGAADGSSWGKDFGLDNARIYLSGQGNDYIGFELNTDVNKDANDQYQMRLLDGVVKLKVSEELNVWFGRFLPPGDRSDLSGPFYMIPWSYPFASNYPGTYMGRMDGAAIWGQKGGGKFKWQVGGFSPTTSYVNDSDELLFSSRLVYNFLDPEPGYYNASTYYGSKEVLAIGVSVMHQNKACGTQAAPGSFTGWSLDLLYDQPFCNGEGCFTIDTAYYDFQQTYAFEEESVGNNVAMSRPGQSFMMTTAVMLPYECNFGYLCGKFQPYYRYQHYNHDASGTEDGNDIGLNYIIDGHNLKLTTAYEQRNPGTNSGQQDRVVMGVQLQF